MSTKPALLFVTCVGFLVQASQALADVVVPDNLKFILRDEHYMTHDEKLAWRRQLHETPKLADSLCDLLWESYRNGGEWLGETMIALMQRDDITPAQMKKITDEMQRLAGLGMTEVKRLGVENLLYGVRILERYPSPEHEELLLLLLKSDDSVLRSNVITTLGQIGTAKSVDAVRKFFDPLRHIKTEPPNDGHQVFEAEQMLLARVAAKAATTSTQQGTTPVKKKSVPGSTKSTAASSEDLDSTPWFVWLVIIGAAMGLLWLLLKKRSK